MPVPVRFASKLYNDLEYTLVLKIADILNGQIVGTVNNITGEAEVLGIQVVGFPEMIAKLDNLLTAGGFDNAT